MPSFALPRRRAGTTDLSLPVLGVGCFTFGGGAFWGSQSQRDVDAVVARALELGANFFDTAETYNAGASETALGHALRGRRDAAIICTKIQPDHAYAADVRRHCEASLARLQTDRLDVFMLHWPLNASALRHYTSDEARLRHPPSIAEALHAMDALRREGKVRHLAVSNFGPRQLAEALAVGVPLALNELPYNLLSRGIEAEALPACARAGVGVLGYMGLAQGLLTGKYATLDALPPWRARTRHFRGERPGSRHGGPGCETETFAAVQGVRALAATHGLAPEDLALAWAAGHPDMTCTLAGARNVTQLEANIRAVQTPLPPALYAELNRLTEDVRQTLGPCLDYYQSPADSRSW
ncbi:MAG: aldo/keto reductase [Verrucomicrobiota bacterium]